MIVQKPKICAVILHYGDPTLTERVRRQLLEANPELSNDIRVLDNAAPVPATDSWIRLEQNLYWAGALHWTLRHLAATEPEYSHLWFLNNDISFASSGPLLSKAAQRLTWISSKLGAVGVYSPAALRNPYHPQMVQDVSQQIRVVRYVDGIAPLLDMAAIAEQGGIDLEGNAFGYGVDIITSLRQQQAGKLVVVDHQLALRHTYHSTARKVSGFMEQAAQAEAVYLEKRLGKDYAHMIDTLKQDFTDYTRL